MERVTAGESRQRTGEGVSPVVSKCSEDHSGVAALKGVQTGAHRSEERRVGKECRSRWSLEIFFSVYKRPAYFQVSDTNNLNRR